MSKILAITCMRDEGPYILEWVAHHRAIGVTDFLIYTNDSSDMTDEILGKLQDEGIVVHQPIEVPKNKSPQWMALKEAWDHPLRKSADWIVVIDVDEFITINIGDGRLKDMFEAFGDDIDGIFMHWRLFGNCDRIRFYDEPVTDQFVQSSTEGYSGCETTYLFKSMFRSGGPFQKLGVHRPKHKPNDLMPRLVDGSGRKVSDHFVIDDKRVFLPNDGAQNVIVEISHFSIKSAHAFLLKVARGLPSSRKKEVGVAYWIERNFNTVENTRLSKTKSIRDQELNTLRAIDGMRILHDKAVKIHIERIQTALGTVDNVLLLRNILVAGSSGGIPERAFRELSTLYQRAVRNQE